MNHHITLTRGKEQEMACEDGNQAIKVVISMLSPTVAAETSSFVVDTSVCGAHHPDQHETTLAGPV